MIETTNKCNPKIGSRSISRCVAISQVGLCRGAADKCCTHVLKRRISQMNEVVYLVSAHFAFLMYAQSLARACFRRCKLRAVSFSPTARSMEFPAGQANFDSEPVLRVWRVPLGSRYGSHETFLVLIQQILVRRDRCPDLHSWRRNNQRIFTRLREQGICSYEWSTEVDRRTSLVLQHSDERGPR